MNVRSCKICKRLFNYIGGLCLCPVCRDEAEGRFATVKEYVYDHPGASIQEVSEKCEVGVEQIRHWLREERLELSKDSSIFLECRSCGKSIQSGVYCDQCKINLHKGFQSVLTSNTPQKESNYSSLDKDNKMRYLTKG